MSKENILKKRQKQIEKFTSALIDNYLEFSNILLYAPRLVTRGNYVCKTDGKIIKVGDKFFELSTQEKVYRLVKTAFHCAFRHHNRAADIRGNQLAHKIWELATSAVINECLEGCFRENRPFSVNMKQIDEVISFSDLKEAVSKLGGDTSKVPNAESLFTILMKGINHENISVEELPSISEANESISDEEFNESSQTLKANGLEDQDYKNQQSNLADSLWNQRLEQTVKQFGSGSGSSLMGLLEHMHKPRINWKRILRNFLLSKLSREMEPDYSRFSRRYQAGMTKIFAPNRKRKKGIKKMVVCLDLSGSCWNSKTQSEFVANIEAVHAVSNTALTLITFDDGVRDIIEIPYGKKLSELINNMEIELTGGGGTSFVEPIEEAVNQGATVIAVMTDCWGPFPEPITIPTIWASIGDPAPWGKTLIIDEDEL